MKTTLFSILKGIIWVTLFIASAVAVIALIEFIQPHPEMTRVKSISDMKSTFPVLVISISSGKITDARLIDGHAYTSGEYKNLFDDYTFLVPEGKQSEVNAKLRSYVNGNVEVQYLSDGRQRISAELVVPDGRWSFNSHYIADSNGITPEYIQIDDVAGRFVEAVMTGGILNLILWVVGAGVRNWYLRHRGKETAKTFLWR